MHVSARVFASVFAVCLLVPLVAWGQTTVLSVEGSPDITVDLSTAVVADEETALDVLVGAPMPLTVGLPTATALTAFHVDDTSTTDVLFGIDVPTALGAITAYPEDVVRLDTSGPTYTLEFDGSTEGVPSGAQVDAVGVSGGNLILSFDTTVALGAFTYDDEDLIERTAPSTFALFFDGSASGVAPALDVDGAHIGVANGSIFVSFDGSGSVGGVPFDDEDVLEFDASATWNMAYDGSSFHAGWTVGDLDALDMSTDADGDGVADGADNCMTVSNPVVVLAAVDALRGCAGCSAATGGQLDDDVDGFGNQCDGDFQNSGGLVNAVDAGLFKGAFFKSSGSAVACGGSPFHQFDLNGSGGLINAVDAGIFKGLFFKAPGPKCPACPLP